MRGQEVNRGHETENKKTVRWRSGTVGVEGRVYGMGWEKRGELGRKDEELDPPK